MKLCKYYSLDESQDRSVVFDKLDDLQNDSKIEYTILEEDDKMIKIKNVGLNIKEIKDLILFFKDNDAIDYPDYEEFYSEDDDEEDEDQEDDDDYDY